MNNMNNLKNLNNKNETKKKPLEQHIKMRLHDPDIIINHLLHFCYFLVVVSIIFAIPEQLQVPCQADKTNLRSCSQTNDPYLSERISLF